MYDETFCNKVMLNSKLSLFTELFSQYSLKIEICCANGKPLMHSMQLMLFFLMKYKFQLENLIALNKKIAISSNYRRPKPLFSLDFFYIRPFGRETLSMGDGEKHWNLVFFSFCVFICEIETLLQN